MAALRECTHDLETRVEEARREWVWTLELSQLAYRAAWASSTGVVSPSLREFLR